MIIMTNMSNIGSRQPLPDVRKRSKIDLLNSHLSPDNTTPITNIPLNKTFDSPSSPFNIHQQYDIPKSPSARSRRQLVLPVVLNPQTRSNLSHETEMKLNEIIKLNRIITIDGLQYLTDISDMEHLGELGNGTCGQVVKMHHKPSGAILAVKQMRRSGNSDENKRILMDLDVVLKSHDCPYIVHCFGCFITESDVWICMELMSTCFDKLIKRLKKPIPEPILGKITVATVKALSYLKEKHGVIHRDVKPSNILIDDRGNVKLCDFGISGRLVDSKAKTRSAGCAAYMAPERIDPPDPKKPDYDVRADVWSLGITLVELAIGEFPYKNCKTDFEVLTKVLQEAPPSLPEELKFTNEFRSFVTSCLTKNYTKRPKYLKLMEHPFIKRYENADVRVDQWLQSISCDNKSDFKPLLANKFVPTVNEYEKPSTSNINNPPNFKTNHTPYIQPNNNNYDKITALLQKYRINSTNVDTNNRQIKDNLIKKYLNQPLIVKEPNTEFTLRPSSHQFNIDNSNRLIKSSNTSPIVLQRFYHQQNQLNKHESRRYQSSSPRRENQFDYLKPKIAERRSISMTRNQRFQSPEPPPRLNRGNSSELSSLLINSNNNLSPVTLRRNFEGKPERFISPMNFQNSNSSSLPASPILFRARNSNNSTYSPDIQRKFYHNFYKSNNS